MTALSNDVLDRLARQRLAWCTTLRSDGSPHTTPVWFTFSADVWWIASAAGNVKVRNVAEDPRVSLALDDAQVPIVAEGRALVHRDDFPLDVVRSFAIKYVGWDITDTERDGPRVLIQVVVVRWLLTGDGQ